MYFCEWEPSVDEVFFLWCAYNHKLPVLLQSKPKEQTGYYIIYGGGRIEFLLNGMLLLQMHRTCRWVLLSMDLHFCKRWLAAARQEQQQNGFGNCWTSPEVISWRWSSSLGFPCGSISKMTLFSTSQLLLPQTAAPGSVTTSLSLSLPCGFLREQIFILLPDGWFTWAAENMCSLSKRVFGLKTSLR